MNFRLRDAIFGRQRYWGEPIPIYYKDGTAYPLPESELPLVLPDIDEYKPTETGEPPLGRATDWKYQGQYDYELSTMPGWAGSSWYYLRYMDPGNENRFVGEAAEAYWHNVDLYMGGAEHATGHLLYSRFWYLFLKDLGLVSAQEPFQKLINQGMILGRSSFVYRLNIKWFAHDAAENEDEFSDEEGPIAPARDDVKFPPIFISEGYRKQLDVANFKETFETNPGILKQRLNQIGDKVSDEANITGGHGFSISSENSFTPLHVDVSIVTNDILDTETFKKWRPDYADAEFILEKDGRYICGSEVEKMSKSKLNVVNPDNLITHYGADALRLYEMFLGPLEQFKPWNTSGMSGVSGFLKKLWRLFHPEDGPLAVTDAAPTPAELKALHKAIRKAAEDVEKFSFNTSVSTFMICVNELTALNCHKRAVLEPLLLIVSPYAPHLAEELWAALGHAPGTVSHAGFPEFREEYLVEESVNYPVAVNGKVREQRQFPATATAPEIEAAVLGSDFLERYGEGKAVKKVIVVPGRMVNVVV